MRALLLVALFVSYRYSVSRRVRAGLDAIRETGHPVTLPELDRWYEEPPPGENAAEAFSEAFLHYVRDEGKEGVIPVFGGAVVPPRGEAIPEETKELMAEYLVENEKALGFLHQAVAIKSCRYPINLTDGIGAELLHLAALRQGARLLKLEAMLHAETGEPERAVRSVVSCLGLARSLDREPVLISHLVRIACEGLGTSALERVLARTQPTDEQLVRLCAALVEVEDTEALTRAFVGERCMGIDLFVTAGNALPEELRSPVMFLWAATGLRDTDLLYYLDVMAAAVEAAQLPLPERLSALTPLGARLENDIPRYCLMSGLLLPALHRAAVHEAQSIALVRTAATAVAVERYRLAQGRLPRTLADLVPEHLEAVPRDPFDGQPLRYRRREKGYVVYSVGEDGADDNGEKGRAWLDVPFTVER